MAYIPEISKDVSSSTLKIKINNSKTCIFLLVISSILTQIFGQLDIANNVNPEQTASDTYGQFEGLNYLSHDIRFQQNGMCSQQSLRSACAYAQSDRSLC